jgi:ABC-type phosphate transport system permease subunit
MRTLERTQNGIVGLLSTVIFVAVTGLLGALAITLAWRANLSAPSTIATLQIAVRESVLLAAIVLPPAVLLGTFLALYWVEYRDERFAAIGHRIGREMARLPDLFVAVALVALVSREQRGSRALLCLAAFVPTLVYVATATSNLLSSLVPVYRGAALALGVRRHHWILASLHRIALRPLLGITLVAFGRVLTSVAPLLVLSPAFAQAPLPVELLRDRSAAQGAVLALALLAIVLVTKGAGRAMLAPATSKRHEPS